MSFSPRRLTIARQRRGLTKGALASQSGISSKTISSYEAGASVPSDESLARLAEATGFPVLYFAGEDERPDTSGISFRAASRIGTRNRHAAEAAAVLCIQQIDVALREQYSLPELSLPEGIDPAQGPEVAAALARAQWGLGVRRAPNMVHLLESRGVRVYSLPQDISQRVDAFCLWNDGQPFVFLNIQKSGERGRFDAAHELGHLLLHAEKENPGSREDEREANEFASAFLMPREEVLATAPRNITLRSALKYKKRWGTSVASVIYRFRTVGLLSEWRYKSLMIELQSAGYRKAEPEGMAHERSKLFEKVFADLQKRGTSANRFARQLNVAPGDLHGMTFGKALAVVSGDGSLAERAPSLRLVSE